MTIVPGRVAGLLLIAVLLPFWSSLLVRTFAWQVLLRDTGVINRFLLDLGVIYEPLTLIRTTTGVILGMSHILLPFMVLPMYAVMRRIDPEFGRAAANLGRVTGVGVPPGLRAAEPARRPRRDACWSSSSPSASTSRRRCSGGSRTR